MRIRVLVALAVFLVFAGWDVWESLGNLVGLAPYYEVLGIADATPWWLLILGILIPLVGIGVGVTTAFRVRGAGRVMIALALILATQAAMAMSVLSAEQAWRAHYLMAQASESVGLD